VGFGHHCPDLLRNNLEIIVPKFQRNPNEMVSSIYSGVAPGGRTVTSITKVAADKNHMETTRIYGAGLPRGQGGQIGVLVLGGMVTTLDEMEYIIAAKREKKFVPRRNGGEIADMCRLLTERRNEQIMEARKRTVAFPPKKRQVRLHLPVGCKYVGTGVPGLKVLARI
jgi:hypothetical protein